MMVTGLSAWRSSCPSGPSTDSPPGLTVPAAAGVARYRPATALPAGGSDGPARQAATGRP
jgi:hypothetical protein